ncbi:FG-GAP-like repeat-containing protein [Agriterribacter sp.]|uniref:FG-GAP-like repeat-containing protein n=1 Tax=Agriterribacter sp. TaxID=2821509 RepID=UPI002CF1FF5C|nr:FG-GAP-like repeat-containing protein [Agriterribacter sp.]HRP55122.1 FG-GAP-like repeat-containing protein [Agriterribacter sp.]
MTHAFPYFRTRLWVGAVLFFIVTLLAQCKPKDEEANNRYNDPRMLAISFLQQNKFDEAEAAFKKAIKTDPGNFLNYADLSLLYMAKKDYDEAERQIQAGLKIQPGNPGLKLTLAEVYIREGDKESAVKELTKILAADSRNAPAWYKLSLLQAAEKNYPEQKSSLLQLVDITPANIVPRLQLCELLAQEGKPDSALFFMQSIKKIVPEFNLATDSIYQKAVALIANSRQTANAIQYIQRFHELVKLTKAYAGGIDEIDQPKLLTGYAAFNDSRFSRVYDKNRLVSLNDIKFEDASAVAGLTIPGVANIKSSTLALADDDGKGTSYVFASFLPEGAPRSKRYLFEAEMSNYKDITSSVDLDHEAVDLDATFADYDNDGYRDLLVSTGKGILIYKNNGDGTFSRIKQKTGLENISDGNKMLVADFDQDGDLDLYVACNRNNKFFRNNNDGTFTENAKMMNLLANASGTIDMDYGDHDADGDLDIAALTAEGKIQLLDNERHSKFKDHTGSLQLADPAYKGSAIAFGDYNNDGMQDLFIAGAKNENSFLLQNTREHGFKSDTASRTLTSSLKGITVHAAIFFDFDNDGYQDILVAGINDDASQSGVQLFHNDPGKGFINVSYLLPQTITGGHKIDIADFNLDGDDDVFISGPSGISLMRNDGGHLNHYMQVQLTGLSYGNNKNNRFGIGAQVELKAGNLYQSKTVKRSLVNFGVGAQDSLDVVRIIWPNGTPQLIDDPSRWQRTLEEEKLKGSCPFLFTWDGEKYIFLKDMMWRSALGMPLAVSGTDTTYAFSDPSKEYLLIPGEMLKPKNNKYSIRITEELWETVYFDKAALIAVDHPDTVDVFADERFVAPPFPGKQLYGVGKKHFPVTAFDGNGINVLPQIESYDFKYISNFGMGKYQGLADDHDLILDLGDEAAGDSLYLFLRGWIFPADASINTAMTQSTMYTSNPPSLEVMNKKGEWQTVIPNIGFPMGKDKMVIVNLSGKFLTANNRKVRIRTNMQIYWDEIFFSSRLSKAPVHMHDLAMTGAQLAYRGYSASYRKGGPFGPHWFDYYNTSGGQKWRDLTGYYTRYGDVLPLMQQADDAYVIANSGDEITIEFDAARLPALPQGWKRDFLIYSEGWVKDGDLNTAHGQTVEPLPFHNMPAYPYRSNVMYPADAQHNRYRQQYNTRLISTDDFKNALKPQAVAEHK